MRQQLCLQKSHQGVQESHLLQDFRLYLVVDISALDVQLIQMRCHEWAPQMIVLQEREARYFQVLNLQSSCPSELHHDLGWPYYLRCFFAIAARQVAHPAAAAVFGPLGQSFTD